MNQDNFMIAFVALLISILLSRMVMSKANKQLDTEKKVELMDLFNKRNTVSYAIVVLIVIAYFLVIRFEVLSINIATITYIALFAVYLLVSTSQSHKKLKAAQFPDKYIQAYLLSTTLRFVGLILFFVLILGA